jgi:Leucine-rich repeat (LRR) protein
LSELRKLQFLDLSDNQIVDCSPLMDLPPMQSLNLMGNPISREQLKRLRTRQPLMRGSDWFQGW